MANTTRERNYRKHPHTASFLQTFHTAMTEAERMAASESDEQAALEFLAEVTEEPKPVAVPAARNDGSRMVTIQGHTVRVDGPNVSEKQAKWIIDIATTRVAPNGATADSVLVRLEQGMAKFAGSQFITNYKDLPRKPLAVAVLNMVDASPAAEAAMDVERPTVADGRYAVEDEDGTLKFYKVKNGRKAGFVFLDVQASDDWFSIRNPKRITAILTAIAEDELSAARRYGMELGKCSRCGRTLTDETSRAYGIGPDCRSK